MMKQKRKAKSEKAETIRVILVSAFRFPLSRFSA